MPSNIRKLILINLNKLETLDGITQNVSDTFIIHGCRNLKSLKGCPQSLQMFACRYCNKLITLEGGPSHVTQTYDIDSCMNLESLKGTPKTISSIEGMFLLNNCPSLKNMDYEPKIRKRNNYSKDYNY